MNPGKQSPIIVRHAGQRAVLLPNFASRMANNPGLHQYNYMSEENAYTRNFRWLANVAHLAR